jgi:glutathione S-transferase
MLQTVEYTHEEMQGHDNLVVGGKQFPHKLEVNKNMLRLYSHPICPFAERARLAFLAKDIKHQICHVDQTGKPDWFVEVGGTVPVIETTEGELIPENDIAIEFAMQASSEGLKLLSEDPIEAAKTRLYVKNLDAGFLMAMFMSQLEGKEETVNKFKDKLNQVESDLSKNTEGNEYLNNQKEVGFADIYISPILTRSYFNL